MSSLSSQISIVAELLSLLSETWKSSNRAIIAFDGARFARLSLDELHLCDEITKLRAACIEGPIVIPEEFYLLLQRRRLLLRSTQRTIRALWGVCEVSRPTYSVSPRIF
jgi:hypothetical protein